MHYKHIFGFVFVALVSGQDVTVIEGDSPAADNQAPQTRFFGGGEGSSSLGAGLLGFGLGIGGTLLAENLIGAQRNPCRYRREDTPQPSTRFISLGGGGHRPCREPYPGGFGGGYPGAYPAPYPPAYPPGPVGYPPAPAGYPLRPAGGYPGGYSVEPSYYPGSYAPNYGFRSASAEGSEAPERLLGDEGVNNGIQP